MAKTANKVLVQWVVAMFLIALASGAMVTSICNIDPSKMKFCLPAVNGMSPPPPTKQCCAVVHSAHLPCLCGYRNTLPAFGINLKHALALPKKCGLKTTPECRVV